MPSLACQVFEHWMMQPGLQAWLYKLLAEALLVALEDRLAGDFGRPLEAPAAEKLRVGRPPASFMILINTAVP